MRRAGPRRPERSELAAESAAAGVADDTLVVLCAALGGEMMKWLTMNLRAQPSSEMKVECSGSMYHRTGGPALTE
jgi:hypothetical protein